MRVVKQRWETERSRASRGESFWREGRDGNVWRERLLWRLLLEEVLLVLVLGKSEEPLVSEPPSFSRDDGDGSVLEKGMIES